MTPALTFPSPKWGKMDNGGMEAILAVARRTHRCAECGTVLDYRERPRSVFCSPRHSQRFRDRQRYHANVEQQRERSRDYYARNREAVLARTAAKRGPRPELACSECGDPLQGQSRVVCSRRCAEARYRRLHPEAYAANEARVGANGDERAARDRVPSLRCLRQQAASEIPISWQPCGLALPRRRRPR